MPLTTEGERRVACLGFEANCLHAGAQELNHHDEVVPLG